MLTLFADSAAQPFLPRIVPRSSLVLANARLGQSRTVAETAGPALGGALLTGMLMTLLGYRLTIGIGAAVFVAATLVVLLSPLRDARHEDAAAETSP